MIVKVAIIEIGIDNPVIIVGRISNRNRKITSTAKSVPNSILKMISWIESLIQTEMSLTIEICTSGGSSFWRLASSARTPSARSTMLAPDWLRIFNATAGEPL